MGATETLRRQVTQALRDARADGLIAVACSHGPDSLALADALIALRPSATALIHVNHGLRPEAAVEAERVAAFAAAHGVPATIVDVEVVATGAGLEGDARAARHAALLAAADELGVRFVALAHTASDQTETVLHRLIRGAGTAGLAGMAPVRDRFLRPLLGVTRSLVEAYVAERRLAPSHDAMNDDRRFLRVRLRHDLLPALRRENPALDDAVGRAARALREADDAVVFLSERAAADAGVRPVDGGGVTLAAAALAAYPPAARKKLFTILATRLGASLEAAHLDALDRLCTEPPRGSASLDLPRLEGRREYGALLLLPRTAPAATEVTVGPDGGPYVVRRWLPGDRMRPAALRGRSRKLQDLFTDRKIPVRLRRQAVVVVRESDHEIVWAEHIGPAHGVCIQVTLTRRDPPVIYD